MSSWPEIRLAIGPVLVADVDGRLVRDHRHVVVARLALVRQDLGRGAWCYRREWKAIAENAEIEP